MAIQLARAAGLHVAATGSNSDAPGLLKLGAHRVIGRDLPPHAQVHAVLELVGGESQARLFDYLAPGQALISAVSTPDQALASQRGVKAEFMLVDVNTATLTALAAMFDEGKLTTWVGSVLPLGEAKTAHEMREGELPYSPGKIVLEIGTEP